MLHRYGAVTPLIDAHRAFAATLAMPPHGVGPGDQLHELGQISVVSRPNNEMKVIRHDAVCEEPHRHGVEPNTTQLRNT